MTSFDEKWEAIHQQREWGRWPDNHLVRFVHRNYPERLMLQALDLGCGGGAQTVFLRKYGFDTVGVDASLAAIERCRQAIPENFSSSLVVGINYQVADVTVLPFPQGHFDLVTDVCCLQHVTAPDHKRALVEVRRVMKPGALLFSLSAKWDHTPSRADTWMRVMRRTDVEQLFNSKTSGFRLVSLDHTMFTDHNARDVISHWIIVARKE